MMAIETPDKRSNHAHRLRENFDSGSKPRASARRARLRRLDRLGRSLKHLVETITSLHAREIGFRSLTEGIETETSGGRLVFQLFAGLAEFEREVIRERTRAGLAADRSRGRRGGCPALMDERKTALAQRTHSDPANTAADICRALGVSRATIYRSLKTAGKPRPASKNLHQTVKPIPAEL